MKFVQADTSARYFIVQCGLTRRLVEADTETDARLRFLNQKQIRNHLAAADAETHVHEASEAEIREFEQHGPARFDGQLSLLDDDTAA